MSHTTEIKDQAEDHQVSRDYLGLPQKELMGPRKHDPSARISSRFASGVSVVFVAALAVMVIAFVVCLRSGTALFRLVQSSFGLGSPVTTSQLVVVRQIQQLQRLDTVMYTLQNVVEGERDPGLLPRFLTGDRLLMIGYGEVVAGVDLTEVGPRDVSVDGRTVSIRLPPAEIFSARIDNQKTKVYSRETGILVPVDPNLETTVRREVERQLRQAAVQDGILNAAAQNARYTMSAFLGGLGFGHVRIL